MYVTMLFLIDVMVLIRKEKSRTGRANAVGNLFPPTIIFNFRVKHAGIFSYDLRQIACNDFSKCMQTTLTERKINCQSSFFVCFRLSL